MAAVEDKDILFRSGGAEVVRTGATYRRRRFHAAEPEGPRAVVEVPPELQMVPDMSPVDRVLSRIEEASNMAELAPVVKLITGLAWHLVASPEDRTFLTENRSAFSAAISSRICLAVRFGFGAVLAFAMVFSFGQWVETCLPVNG